MCVFGIVGEYQRFFVRCVRYPAPSGKVGKWVEKTPEEMAQAATNLHKLCKHLGGATQLFLEFSPRSLGK